ncbi:hypothetical protein CAEBREN_06984 [Caenorhabditis brenneri]|uniref:Uncharacterized protein n=1 Tax=Caenorhabditis brenneri TaxID=135651 RepID=G0P412_CAEBE|nr:hypothetical protein CAEBREN_06984 [Caenorhabditis brenneri]
MVASSSKTVLLCAPCPDPDPKNSEKDNTQMSLEVSKITTQARPMTTSEIKAANLKISDLIKWFKDLFKDGKMIYDKAKAAGIIYALKAVGDIISGILTILGHNPIAEGLNDLNKEVKQLAEKMTRCFNDMKAFISEVKFLEKVITPASILIKHMMDCINHPGPEALEKFKNAYSRHSPLMIMSTIVTNLEQKSTNPVRLAMDNAVSQKATFTKWLTLIENVLGQLLILEAFATGLLKTQNQFNCEQILEETQSVQKTMDDLKAEYGFDNYWDEFKTWLESMARQWVNLITRIEMIRTQLNTYKTTDEDEYRKLMLREFKNSGFTALVGDDLWIIGWANCPKHVLGPGWFTREDPFSGPPECFLIVGFR